MISDEKGDCLLVARSLVEKSKITSKEVLLKNMQLREYEDCDHPN